MGKTTTKKPWQKRFWAKVDKGENCWEWTGSLTVNYGYGKFWYKEKVWVAHRVMWDAVFGEIPEGIEVCHACDNPKCVNPAHLFLGTHRENMDDKVNKGRHKVGYNRLTEKQVIKIKKLVKFGHTSTFLAKRFKVSDQAIYDIRSGKSWEYVKI